MQPRYPMVISFQSSTKGPLSRPSFGNSYSNIVYNLDITVLYMYVAPFYIVSVATLYFQHQYKQYKRASLHGMKLQALMLVVTR